MKGKGTRSQCSMCLDINDSRLAWVFFQCSLPFVVLFAPSCGVCDIKMFVAAGTFASHAVLVDGCCTLDIVTTILAFWHDLATLQNHLPNCVGCTHAFRLRVHLVVAALAAFCSDLVMVEEVPYYTSLTCWLTHSWCGTSHTEFTLVAFRPQHCIFTGTSTTAYIQGGPHPSTLDVEYIACCEKVMSASMLLASMLASAT